MNLLPRFPGNLAHKLTLDQHVTREFSAYGPSHWAVIAVFAVGAIVLVWVGRRQTEQQARRLGRILGALTAVIYAAILI